LAQIISLFTPLYGLNQKAIDTNVRLYFVIATVRSDEMGLKVKGSR
jgi:predicted subunit of tRNA(5-methylaminomethyl-2-thiouridylate) methyltransferase